MRGKKEEGSKGGRAQRRRSESTLQKLRERRRSSNKDEDEDEPVWNLESTAASFSRENLDFCLTLVLANSPLPDHNQSKDVAHGHQGREHMSRGARRHRGLVQSEESRIQEASGRELQIGG